MKKTIVFLLTIMFITIISCKEKKITDFPKEQIESIILEEKKSEIIEEKKDEIIERKFVEPLKVCGKYDFQPIDNVDITQVLIVLNDDNEVCVYYNDLLLIKFLTSFKIDSILNQCEPYSDNRLYSSSFHLDSGKKTYFGLISFNYGYVKIYEWLPTDPMLGWTYYSGYSKYFVIEHDWIEKESHYDALKFKNVPAIYDGNLILYDIETDSIPYYIDSKELHEEILLSIDKIQYEDDGFRITIGNHYDSDEYVDFKLFTDNDNFRYEIYDKYSYSDDDTDTYEEEL